MPACGRAFASPRVFHSAAGVSLQDVFIADCLSDALCQVDSILTGRLYYMLGFELGRFHCHRNHQRCRLF